MHVYLFRLYLSMYYVYLTHSCLASPSIIPRGLFYYVYLTHSCLASPIIIPRGLFYYVYLTHSCLASPSIIPRGLFYYVYPTHSCLASPSIIPRGLFIVINWRQQHHNREHRHLYGLFSSITVLSSLSQIVIDNGLFLLQHIRQQRLESSR
jgi:hypothetical protein